MRSHRETHYSRSFWKYIHTWKKQKWNNHITRERKSQSDVSRHQVKPPVIGMCYIYLSCWPKWFMETTKQPKLLPKQLMALHKLMVGPYSWRQNLYNSSNMEKSSDTYLEPLPLLEGTLQDSRGERENTNPATNPLIYNGDPPASYAGIRVVQRCGSNQPLSYWISGPLHKKKPMLDTAQVTKKNLRLDKPWT